MAMLREYFFGCLFNARLSCIDKKAESKLMKQHSNGQHETAIINEEPLQSGFY